MSWARSWLLGGVGGGQGCWARCAGRWQPALCGWLLVAQAGAGRRRQRLPGAGAGARRQRCAQGPRRGGCPDGVCTIPRSLCSCSSPCRRGGPGPAEQGCQRCSPRFGPGRRGAPWGGVAGGGSGPAAGCQQPAPDSRGRGALVGKNWGSRARAATPRRSPPCHRACSRLQRQCQQCPCSNLRKNCADYFFK